MWSSGTDHDTVRRPVRAKFWIEYRLLNVICQDAADDLAKSALDLLGVLGMRS